MTGEDTTAVGPATPSIYIPGVGPRRNGLTVPGPALASFESFRAWKLSADCPRWGKFEWIGGRVRLEVEPEPLFSHNTPRLAFVRTLGDRIDVEDRDFYLSARSPVVSPDGAARRVNCESDFLYLSHESILSGRVTFTPHPTRTGDAVEIVGPPDMVAEVRADSSTRRDTVDLPADLFALGVTEYWLADARTEPPALTIHARGETAFESVPADADGFAASTVFGHRYKLETVVGRSGLRRTRLLERPPG